MKEIKAYIKRHKLEDVLRALRRVPELTGVSIHRVEGFGQGWHDEEAGADYLARRPAGIKLEIICRAGLVEAAVAAIEQAAHTGLKGDGKIYVGNIEQALRISTGQRGVEAI